MNERRTDFELLRAFTLQGEQAAFAALARRHLDLVYATALRKTGDSGAAEEVAQNVLLGLARKAWQFAPDNSLPAWLYRAALLESKEWLRGELRRRRREQTAVELATTMNTPDQEAALRALLPLLDEALLSLREKDRTALLLRFYENQSLREVGAAMGVGEDAAQKRVAAALQKLTGFFQRRGFKTATLSAAAAALQRTAVSAPAAVSASVTQAAAQIAPPALGGLMALAARCAGLSKVQTAALCLALVALPVGWQLRQKNRANLEVQRAQAELAAAQSALADEQLELTRLTQRMTRLAEAEDQARLAAERRAATAQQYEQWKRHLLAVLTADPYRWPADSPFVRIPKSALSQLRVERTLASPGTLSPEARELLGLTPQERQQVEAALQKHIATVDELVASAAVETNATGRISTPGSSFSIPGDALASVGWALPALGEPVQHSVEQLESSLQNLLGAERWALVEQVLEGSSDARHSLYLDSAQRPQALAVWIQELRGKPTVGFGSSGGYGSFMDSGMSLSAFLPDAAPTRQGNPSPLDWLCEGQLSPSLAGRVQSWLEQQALSRCGKDSGQ